MTTLTRKYPVALTLAATLAAAAPSGRAALAEVYRATTIVYANLTEPMEMDFAADGTMFVGNGAASGAVRIWRVGPGGRPVEPFGSTNVADPDAVVVDRTGAISGTSGAVLVAGGAGGGVPSYLKAIALDGTMSDIATNLSGFPNPHMFTFDPTGRLLLLDYDTGNWGVVSPSPPSVSVLGRVAGNGTAIVVDASNRVVVASSADGQLRLFNLNGAFLRALDVGAKSGSPLAAANRSFWGTNIYAVDPTGRLLSVDLAGQVTVKGRGFQDAGDLLFGDDGSLYVSELVNNRILKITPDGGPTVKIYCSLVEVCWNSLTNHTYQLQYRSDLTTNQWVNVGSPIPGTGNITCLSVSVRNEEQRYYRAVETPSP